MLDLIKRIVQRQIELIARKAPMLTEDQLKQIMPKLGRQEAKLKTFLPELTKAMQEGEINTPERIAAFLAQLALESGEFLHWEELWGPSKQQLRYEPPSSLATRLGNTKPGDGYKYRGRGPIQLTGRYNYRAAGSALGVPLEEHPERAAWLDTGFRIAVWFWNSRKLNGYADVGDFDAITLRINGGYNGKLQRDAYYKKAKEILGVKEND